MKSYQEAENQLNACIQQIRRGLEALDWADPSVYAAWLSQTHCYVRYTTRFIAYAAGHCSLEQEPIFSKLVAGLTEEKGHDIMLVRDLRALGRDPSEFTENPETAAYRQTLFRNIQTDGPIAVLGYAVPLEGMASTAAERVLRQVRQAYGDEGSSFLRAHCELDDGHFTEKLALLRKLDPQALSTLGHYFQYSTALYLGILNAVSKIAAKELLKAA